MDVPLSIVYNYTVYLQWSTIYTIITIHTVSLSRGIFLNFHWIRRKKYSLLLFINNYNLFCSKVLLDRFTSHFLYHCYCSFDLFLNFQRVILKIGEKIITNQVTVELPIKDPLREGQLLYTERTLSKSPMVCFRIKLMHFNFWGQSPNKGQNGWPKVSYTQKSEVPLYSVGKIIISDIATG